MLAEQGVAPGPLPTQAGHWSSRDRPHL